MRKQYHFWPADPASDAGSPVGAELSGAVDFGTVDFDAVDFDAWDVDRLIELSRNLPIERVELQTIGEIDSSYWFAGSDEVPTVRAIAEHARLIADVDTEYPIILGPEGRVMDGMHRIARALLEGRRDIHAVRFSALPEPDHRHCRPADLEY